MSCQAPLWVGACKSKVGENESYLLCTQPHEELIWLEAEMQNSDAKVWRFAHIFSADVSPVAESKREDFQSALRLCDAPLLRGGAAA